MKNFFSFFLFLVFCHIYKSNTPIYYNKTICGGIIENSISTVDKDPILRIIKAAVETAGEWGSGDGSEYLNFNRNSSSFTTLANQKNKYYDFDANLFEKIGTLAFPNVPINTIIKSLCISRDVKNKSYYPDIRARRLSIGELLPLPIVRYSKTIANVLVITNDLLDVINQNIPFTDHLTISIPCVSICNSANVEGAKNNISAKEGFDKVIATNSSLNPGQISTIKENILYLSGYLNTFYNLSLPTFTNSISNTTLPSGIDLNTSKIASQCLFVTDHIVPYLAPEIHNSVLNMYSGASTAPFNLTLAEQAISTTPGVNFEYYISQTDAIAGNGNIILKPSAYISGNATIYVRVLLASCFKVAELGLNVHAGSSRKNAECPVQFSWTGPITFSAGDTKAHGTIGPVGYTFESDQVMIKTNGIQHHSSFPASYGVPNSNPSIGNTTVSNNNLIFDEPMDGILLVFSSIGNPGLSVPIIFDKPVQVIWSQNVTVNSPTQITGTEGNAIVKVLGVHDSVSFHYTQSENYASFTFGANNTVNCVDSDGDGLLDVDDLDDDNDGILDTVECAGNEIVANGKFTNNANDWTLGQGWTSTGSAIEIVENHVLDSDVSQSLTNLRKTNNFIPLSLTLGAQDASQAAGSTASLQVLLNNVVYATINNSVIRSPSINNVTMALANGATSNFTPFSTASISGFTTRNFTINIPNSNIPDTAVVTFRANTELDDWLLDDISVKAFTCDRDGDGVFDHLDLDSDNDGCLDSVEGDENVNMNQLVNAGGIVTSGPGSSAPNKNICQTNSCIDVQGVPMLVNPGGTADIGNDQGQGLGSSQDPDINPCFCEVQITGDLSFCEGASTVLTAAAAGTGNTFSWSNGVIGPVNTITAAGVYTVTVTNPFGVQCEVSVTVEEHSKPIVKNTSLNFCSDIATATFDLTSAEGSISTTSGITFTYYENLADANAGNGNNIPNPTVYSSGNNTIYVRVAIESCYSIAELQLTVNVKPTPAINASSLVICHDIPITLTSSLPTGNIWSTGETTQSIIVSATGIYTLINNNGICQNDPVSVTVLKDEDPDLQISGNLIFCEGDSTILTATANGTGNTFVWNTSTTGNTLTVTAPGIYTVTVTTSLGCQYQKSVTVNMDLPIIVNILPPSQTITCLTPTITLDATGSVYQPGAIFEWTVGIGGNIVSGANTLTPVVDKGGVYTLTIKNNHPMGCIKQSSVIVLENSTPPSIVLSATQLTICKGDSVILTASGAISYIWTGLPGTGNTQTVSPTDTTIYTVEGKGSNGCVAQSTLTITVVPAIKSSLLDIILCEKQKGLLDAGLGPNYTYSWSTGETTRTIEVTQDGSYTVTISNGVCSKIYSANVSYAQIPDILEIIYKDDALRIVVENNENLALEFSIDDGVTWQNSNIFYNVLKNTEYTIRVRNIRTLCDAETLYYTFFLPNAITPNGDGKNDVINFGAMTHFNNFSATIFDRYGQQIFKATKSNPIWDGTYLGRMIPTATYWYNASWEDRISGKSFKISGWILLKNRNNDESKNYIKD